MHRDDLILQGLAAGAMSTATLAEHTGISTASVWRGLRRLMQSGQVFSPVRGIYRLTPTGAALLVLPDRVPPAAPEPSAGAADDQPLVIPASSQTGPGDRPDAMDDREGEIAAASASIAGHFDWGAFGVGVVLVLGVLALSRLGLALLAARQDAPPRSEPPEESAQPGAYVPPWANWR
jgi:biotin operon repressor